jgi:hypothetical protein
MFHSPVSAVGCQFDNTPFTGHWPNFSDTHFRGFLNDQIHALATANSLQEDHPQWRFPVDLPARANTKFQSAAAA